VDQHNVRQVMSGIAGTTAGTRQFEGVEAVSNCAIADGVDVDLKSLPIQRCEVDPIFKPLTAENKV
jgi:hypothetical protein